VRRAQRGFTLVELMISLVLFLIAIAGTLNIAVSMSQAYRDERGVILTEASVRAPMDFMADAIRSASPAVPTATGVWNAGVTPPTYFFGTVTETLSSNCYKDAIHVVDNTTGPDELYVTYASGGVLTSLHDSGFVSGGTSITVTDASQINPGDYLLISDLATQGILVQVATTAGSVNVATGDITLATPACTPSPTLTFNATNLVLRARRAHFYVGAVDAVPTLMMDPDADGPAPAEPLAENIEDMQIALGVDTDGDKSVSASEWAFSSGIADLAGSLRAVRITLVARAPNQLNPLTATYQRPNTEDRTDIAPLDTYRRRVLTSTIEVRNLSGSP
jgi:type IV pilus assembly protein PilW